MKYIPLGPRIKIKVLDGQNMVSSGGIIIDLGDAQENMEFGEIVDLGHMAYGDQEEWVKIGDHVLFQKYAGKLVKEPDGHLYRYLRDIDIIAKKVE